MIGKFIVKIKKKIKFNIKRRRTILTDDILQYERLVHYMVNKYHFKGEYEDLYQAGMLGLKEAFLHYDPKRESDFVDYAAIYIKGEILKAVNSEHQIKKSRELLKLQQEIKSTKEELIQTFGRDVTSQEIAFVLNEKVETIEEAENLMNPVYSLDQELMQEENSNLYQTIAMREKAYDAGILDLRTALSTLEQQEQQIITSRYYEDRTQQETAEVLGISQVQVSRQEKKILKKLKTNLTS